MSVTRPYHDIPTTPHLKSSQDIARIRHAQLAQQAVARHNIKVDTLAEILALSNSKTAFERVGHPNDRGELSFDVDQYDENAEKLLMTDDMGVMKQHVPTSRYDHAKSLARSVEKRMISLQPST